MSVINGEYRFIFEPLALADKDEREANEIIIDYDTGHVYASDGAKVLKSKTIENENRHNAYFESGGANNMKVSVNSLISDTIADALGELYAHTDSVSQGLSVKDSCKCTTTGSNITLSGLQTIDGYTLKSGDRVLVRNQTNAVYNGIWEAQTVGWSRPEDFNESADIAKGAYTFIENGTLYDNSGWVLMVDQPVLGVNQIHFQQFTGAGQITPMGKLYKDGNKMYMHKTNVAGTYFKLTIDEYGTVTAGTNPTTRAGFGITDAAYNGLNLTAGNGLTGGGTLTSNRTFAVNPGNGISIVNDKVVVNAHTGIDVDANGVSLNKDTVQDYAGECITNGTKSNIDVTYDNGTNKINFNVKSASVSEKGVVQLTSEYNNSSVTVAANAKALKDGLGTKLNGNFGTYSRYFWSVNVKNGVKYTFKQEDGTEVTQTTTGEYLVKMITESTSTPTGAIYRISGNGSTWTAENINGSEIIGNHPKIIIENNVPKITMNHASEYNVTCIIEGTTRQTIMYEWQSGIFGEHHLPTWSEIAGRPTDFNPNTETVQDIVGGMLTGNSETNISVTYNDSTGKMDFSVASASVDAKGVVQLTNSYGSTSQTLAATAKALKEGLATKVGTGATAADSEKLKGINGDCYVRGNGPSRCTQFDNTLDVDKIKEAGFYTAHTYQEGKEPWGQSGTAIYGSLIHVPFYNSVIDNRNDHQLAFRHQSARMKLRVINASAEPGPWVELYSEAHKPTKSDVGLGNINNWSAATACSDGSTSKYTRASETNWLYNNKLSITGTAVNSQKLNNASESVAATGNTIAKRDGDGNLSTGDKLTGAGFELKYNSNTKSLSFIVN